MSTVDAVVPAMAISSTGRRPNLSEAQPPAGKHTKKGVSFPLFFGLFVFYFQRKHVFLFFFSFFFGGGKIYFFWLIIHYSLLNINFVPFISLGFGSFLLGVFVFPPLACGWFCLFSLSLDLLLVIDFLDVSQIGTL